MIEQATASINQTTRERFGMAQAMLQKDGFDAIAVTARDGVSAEALQSARRTKDLTVPRQIAMYLIKEIFGLSLVEIGKMFGGRDHSTVIHSIAKVEDDLKTNSELGEKVTIADAREITLPNGRPGWEGYCTFSTAGTYDYHCIPHESLGMTGTITVHVPGSIGPGRNDWLASWAASITCLIADLARSPDEPFRRRTAPALRHPRRPSSVP